MKKSVLSIVTTLTIIVTILQSTKIIDFSWWIVGLLIAATIYLIVNEYLFTEKKKEKVYNKPVIESEHKSEFMKRLQKAMEESSNNNTFQRANEFGTKTKSKFMQRLEEEMERKQNKNK